MVLLRLTHLGAGHVPGTSRPKPFVQPIASPVRLECRRTFKVLAGLGGSKGKAQAPAASPPAPPAPQPDQATWQQQVAPPPGIPGYPQQEGYEAAPPEYAPPPPPYAAQQYYQGYLPPYAYPPPVAETKSGGIPAFVWVGVGILIATGYNKVMQFVSGGPGGAQDKMAQMMMQQMMSSMGKQGGPGSTPPPNPFAGFTPPPPPSGGFGGGGAGARSPPIDTTARAVEAPMSATSASTSAQSGPSGGAGEGESSEGRRGARFEEAKAKERERRSRKKAVFSDVEDEEASSSAESNGANGAHANGAGAGPAGGNPNFTTDMLDTLMRDPSMQQMLYKYLPEGMRNPETFEWMLSNPEYRKQLEVMIQQQGFSMTPDMLKMMGDLDTDEVNRQLDGLGLTPGDVIKKIMDEPELAAAFQKPKVMQAIMESQKNPMAIVNYQNDPDVMLVFEKMASMFPQAGAAGAPGGKPE